MVLRTNAWRHAAFGGAALAIAARVVVPRAWAEGGMPSTPYDAKGLLKTAIRDDNPVIFFEDKMMYKQKGAVPAEDYTIPFGVADVKREGEDITLVATSSMVEVALVLRTSRGRWRQRGSD